MEGRTSSGAVGGYPSEAYAESLRARPGASPPVVGGEYPDIRQLAKLKTAEIY